MSAGKQDKDSRKGVPTRERRLSEPEKNGWERVSAVELGLEARCGKAATDRRGDPVSAPADPQSAGRAGEKPQSEPSSSDPLDSKPLDSGAPGDAKPLKSFEDAAGEAEGKVGLSAALDVIQSKIMPPPLGKAVQMPLPIVVEPEGERDGEAQAVAVRGPGRPKGSRNKRTAEWIDYLLHDRQPPLLVLAETYSRPVDQLAEELGCSRFEAYKLQLYAAEKLAPYVHQKQPLAVEVDARGVVTLVIEGGLPGGGRRAAGAGEGGKPAEGGGGMREEAGGVVVIEGQVVDVSGEADENE